MRRRARVEEAIEKFSVIKALQAVDSANVVIGVIDAHDTVAEQDASLFGMVAERGRALLIAVNKWDGIPSDKRDEIRMGDYAFSVERGGLRRGDETIKLTERERDLLRLFASRPGSPIARHELASDESTGSERAIDVQINRLRRKIELDPSNPVYLQTVRGKGYILYID